MKIDFINSIFINGDQDYNKITQYLIDNQQITKKTLSDTDFYFYKIILGNKCDLYTKPIKISGNRVTYYKFLLQMILDFTFWKMT